MKEDLEDSVQYYQNAISLYGKANLPDLKAVTMYELGLVLKQRRDYDKAKEYIERGLGHFEERGMDLWNKRCKIAMDDFH